MVEAVAVVQQFWILHRNTSFIILLLVTSMTRWRHPFPREGGCKRKAGFLVYFRFSFCFQCRCLPGGTATTRRGSGVVSRLEFKLLNAWLIEDSQQGHFFATIVHRQTNFRTSLFPARNGKMELAGTGSFMVDFIPSEARHLSHPFLTICLRSVKGDSSFESTFEETTLLPFLEQGGLKQRRESRKRKHVLLLPSAE